MSKEYAQRIFNHYFSILMNESGKNWDYDNCGEVDDAIDDIVKAAKAEIREEFGERFKKLEATINQAANTASCLANGIIPD